MRRECLWEKRRKKDSWGWGWKGRWWRSLLIPLLSVEKSNDPEKKTRAPCQLPQKETAPAKLWWSKVHWRTLAFLIRDSPNKKVHNKGQRPHPTKTISSYFTSIRREAFTTFPSFSRLMHRRQHLRKPLHFAFGLSLPPELYRRKTCGHPQRFRG